MVCSSGESAYENAQRPYNNSNWRLAALIVAARCSASLGQMLCTFERKRAKGARRPGRLRSHERNDKKVTSDAQPFDFDYLECLQFHLFLDRTPRDETNAQPCLD